MVYVAPIVSFPRKRESRFSYENGKRVWIPAFPPKADPPQADAGMTVGEVFYSGAAERTCPPEADPPPAETSTELLSHPAVYFPMGKGRLELPRACAHSALNAACLPIPPLARAYHIEEMNKLDASANSATAAKYSRIKSSPFGCFLDVNQKLKNYVLNVEEIRVIAR